MSAAGMIGPCRHLRFKIAEAQLVQEVGREDMGFGELVVPYHLENIRVAVNGRCGRNEASPAA
jgi:hypothetical protein